MTANPEGQWFGEKQVDPNDKASLVRDVFDNVAENYDIMNDAMSFGVHRIWKDRLIAEIKPKAGLTYLDVAGGTGDIAFRINKQTGDDANIIVCDINYEMLHVGRDRAINKGQIKQYEWVTGNAESLPIPSNSVDVYTIAFGLRNVTKIDTALKEAVRVLRPGGRFFCLEFSHVENPIMSKIYDIYSYKAIPTMGQLIAKDKDSYQYLVESIRKFPKQRNLQQRMLDAGFDQAKYKNLSNGIACIHEGWVL